MIRQPNTAIAGSPRNSFWTSLDFETYGGRALTEFKGASALLNSIKLRMPYANFQESDREG